MTATATHILEEFKQLAPAEKQEVMATLAQEAAAAIRPSALRERLPARRIRLDPVLANEIALSDALNPEEV